jgi:hypothetical protein
MSFVYQYKEIFVDEYFRFQSSNDSPVIYDFGSSDEKSRAFFKMLNPKSIIIAFKTEQEIANYDKCSKVIQSIQSIYPLNVVIL